jgi:hypothetical protein
LDKVNQIFELDFNVNNILHVDFIWQKELFVCLKDKPSMNLYNCLDKILIEEYLFDSRVLQCSTIETYRALIIRLTCEKGLI